MDLSQDKKIHKILTRRRVSTDGTITIDYKLKPRVIRKVVVARGRGEHSMGGVVLSQLIPFRPYMVNQLKSRGFDTSRMNWKGIVALYHNEFVSNQHNKQSPFTPINTFEFCNNLSFKVHPKDNLIGDIRDFRNAEGMGQVGNVVDNIVNTYKFARAKYNKAVRDGINPKDVLTDVELRQALDTGKVSKRLKKKDSDNYSVKQGDVRKIIIWAIVIYLLYYLLK